MPRRSRLRLPGYPLHVVQRGVNRSDCFTCDRDRRTYLGLLDELADMYACRIHAYVLMTNHVHMLMTPDRVDGPSLLMKHLGQRFVQYINRKHNRTGPLWDGRFKSCLVDTETYLMRCYRYVEMNPVRAGMVECPEQFEWSSFRANGLGESSLFVRPHDIYLRLGTGNGSRLAAYRSLFLQPLTARELQRIRDATNSGSALGDDDFIARVESESGQRACNARAGRPARPEANELPNVPRIGNRATSPV
jgi:putative transposase